VDLEKMYRRRVDLHLHHPDFEQTAKTWWHYTLDKKLRTILFISGDGSKFGFDVTLYATEGAILRLKGLDGRHVVNIDIDTSIGIGTYRVEFSDGAKMSSTFSYKAMEEMELIDVKRY
jgi:hypothetical protein